MTFLSTSAGIKTEIAFARFRATTIARIEAKAQNGILLYFGEPRSFVISK